MVPPASNTGLTIGFIGAGNMARSLAGGLLNNGWDRARMMLSDPLPDQRQGAEAALGVKTTADNSAVAAHADILVLAVKPQVIADVARGLTPVVSARRPLVISLVAGVRLDSLERWLGAGTAIVRVMPNTPALIGSGASGLYANPGVTEAQREQAEAVLRAVGITVWLDDESKLDIVTALSGSGPAYFFLVMEALEEAAVAAGLNRDQARLLAIETAVGAARMAIEGGGEPAVLRRHVTSPGGTTEAAIKVLVEGGLPQLFDRAVKAATTRAQELGELFGSGPGGSSRPGKGTP